MPRRPHVDPPQKFAISFPGSLYARLQLHLFSALEGRVPYAAFSTFMAERTREFFDSRRLELTPYNFPAGYHVYGPKEMIEALELKLKGTE